MCSACITSSPAASKSAVEQSRRSLMFAECAERISTAPISSQAARSAPTRTWRVIGSTGSSRALLGDDRPGASTSARHPGGSTGSPRAARTRRARGGRVPAAGLAAQDLAPRPAGAEPRPAPSARSGRPRRPRGAWLGAATTSATRTLTSSTRRRGRGSRSVARARRRSLRQLRRVGLERPRHRQLERLAAVAQLVGDLGPARVGEPLASALAQSRRPRRRSAPRSARSRRASRCARCRGGARRRPGRAPRGRRWRAGRGSASIPSSSAIAAACIGPGAAERQQREAARVDAALDRDHPQRPDHLLVGDPDDPLGRLELVEAELVAERGDGARGRLDVELDARRRGGVRREVAEQQVGVGDRRLGRRRARSRPGPGSAPAERGPTRSAPPGRASRSSRRRRPTVWTSTIGSWITRPPISRESVRRTRPSSTTQTSHEVPPMSKPSALPSAAEPRQQPGADRAAGGPREHAPGARPRGLTRRRPPPEDRITSGSGSPRSAAASPRRPR